MWPRLLLASAPIYLILSLTSASVCCYVLNHEGCYTGLYSSVLYPSCTDQRSVLIFCREFVCTQAVDVGIYTYVYCVLVEVTVGWTREGTQFWAAVTEARSTEQLKEKLQLSSCPTAPLTGHCDDPKSCQLLLSLSLFSYFMKSISPSDCRC